MNAAPLNASGVALLCGNVTVRGGGKGARQRARWQGQGVRRTRDAGAPDATVGSE